ncbi:MAG: response regulator [Lachnospiraceae bacterium]|nr:response regulator [Lachnospiraceae bacterium]
MDKIKILLTGKHQITINDFFNHLSVDFDLLTTSFRYDDIVKHINLFHPDIFIICLNGETREELSIMVELKRQLTRDGIVVFIVGSHEDCNLFNETVVYLAEETFTKPISIDNIRKGIIQYVDEREKKRIEEAEMQAALEQIKEYERRKHVLVIDDDPIMLKVVKDFLHENYDVATAINAKIAYKFLDGKTTDMILLDYEMPGEDGPMVFGNLRQRPELSKTPIIFLTGVTDKSKITAALALKPQGYLLKPIDKERLIGTIEKFIG